MKALNTPIDDLERQLSSMNNQENQERLNLQERRELIIKKYRELNGFEPDEETIKRELDFIDKCMRRLR